MIKNKMGTFLLEPKLDDIISWDVIEKISVEENGFQLRKTDTPLEHCRS
jgi:hypothetical protein